MADNDPVFLTRDAARRTGLCVRDFERRPKPPRPGSRIRGTDGPPIRGILLEDLVNEGTADCAVTVKVSSPALQKISVLGKPSTGSNFTLSFKGQTTANISIRATAADVKAALELLTTIGVNNTSVALGETPATIDEPEFIPGVWLVSFVGTFLTRDPSTIPLLTTSVSGSLWAVISQVEQWADSGEVEMVTAMTPVGSPTPMRAGAVVTAIQFPGIGYGVMTCEPRLYTNPYNPTY